MGFIGIGGRKFALAVGAFVVMTVGLFAGVVSDGSFVVGLGVVFGFYSGANVAGKLANREH
jgi:hypothetical protein